MTRKLAFLFPGQGVLPKGLPPDNQLSRGLLKLSSRAGIALEEWLQEQQGSYLSQTRYAQPAIFVDSVSKEKSLRARGVVPYAVAGHSLGEYAALVSAEVLKADEAFHVVVSRGRLMGKVTGGGMSAILKLPLREVNKVCASAGEDVVVANINAPTQIVISGPKDGLERVMASCEALGGRSVRLDVSGPFHSKLLARAQKDLSPVIESLSFYPPKTTFVSSVSGRKENDPSFIKALLLTQITACVKWIDTVESLVGAGIDMAIEVGPGRVLTNLGRRITDKIEFLTFEEAINGTL
jgi:[acyl-carrier-protein] S-malonyltransferase